MKFLVRLYFMIRAFGAIRVLRFLPKKSPMVFKGEGSSLHLCNEISMLGFRKVLLVTDNFLAESGLLYEMQASLRAAGVEYIVYDGVLPNPDFDSVIEGDRAYGDNGCDAIVSVGGGSVLDAAKMMALLHDNRLTLDKFEGVSKSNKPAVPHFAVPTTAGTGAEITPVAVISDPATHRKVLITDGKMLPDYIALDPVIMQGLPPSITAATGIDALTHAVEAYLSRGATEKTDREARLAVNLIFRYLLRAYRNGDDMEARDAMATASFYAGTSFGVAGVGYVHAIAHQLGRLFGTPHGNANAMVFPEVLAAYGHCVFSRLAELARLVGVGAAEDNDEILANKFVAAIVEMRSTMDMPLQIENFTPQKQDDVVRSAGAEAGNMYPVPRYLDESDLQSIVSGLVAV